MSTPLEWKAAMATPGFKEKRKKEQVSVLTKTRARSSREAFELLGYMVYTSGLIVLS